MRPPDVRFRELARDLKIGLIFFTRLPLGHQVAIENADLARAFWAAPLVGAIVGLLGACAYGLANLIGLSPFVAATLALATTMIVTGCLHEDGLADVADGFGGGATRERKLEIMRDSRIGTYGVCVLVTSLLLRAGALASLSEPALAGVALVAAHTASRATLPAFMTFVPPARNDGLSASLSTPSRESVVAAGFLGIVSLVVGFGFSGGTVSALLVLAVFAFMRWLCVKQVGGQTGDVLGALQQACEVLVLLIATAIL